MKNNIKVGEAEIIPEFQWGEEVEVRDSDTGPWINNIFVGVNPKDIKYRFITVDETGNSNVWKQCRKVQQPEIQEMTIKEIAEKLNINPALLKIKE